MTEGAEADHTGLPSFTLHGGGLDLQAARTIGAHLQVLPHLLSHRSHLLIAPLLAGL